MEKKRINDQMKFNLTKFLKLCLKYWYLFVASVVCTCVLALAYIYIRKPAVEVDAQLMLPPETTAGGNILSLSDLASSFSMGDIFGGSSTENEMMSMKSYGVFLQTAKDLNLNTSYFEKLGFLKWMPAYEKSQLSLTTAPSVPDTITATLQFRLDKNSKGNFDISIKARKKKIFSQDDVALPATLSTSYGEFTIAKTEYYGKGAKEIKSFKIKFSSYSFAAQSYQKVIKIFSPNKKADFINISYNATDTDFGLKLLNTLISNYNLSGNEVKYDASNRTLGFVNTRIESLEKELAASEANMEQFKKSNKLTDVEVDAATLLQKSSTLEASLLLAQTENEILHNTKAFLANPQNNYSLIPSLSAVSGEMSAGMTAASSEIASYNELIIERMKLLGSAKVNNASLKMLNDQIDALRNNIISSVDRAYNNSQVKLNKIKQENTLTQSRMGSIPTLEKEYIGLERTLILQQQLYLFLLKQREEAQMNLAKTTPSLITVDAPYVLADPPGLTNTVVLLLAILLGGLIPLFIIYYSKMNESSFSSTAEIKDACDAPVIGDIDYLKGAEGIVLDNEKEGESLRMLRSNLLFTLEEFNGKVILVSSTVAGEGKTFTASNLAVSLALIGKNVLIIDANLRNPALDVVFGLNNSRGIVQMLESSDTSYSDYIQQYHAGNGKTLSVVTSGAVCCNPADVLGLGSLNEAMSQFSAEYDYIIIDSAPLKDYSDTFAFAECSDITLYLTRIGLTTPIDTKFINTLYTDGRLKRIGIVANGVK